MNRDSLTKHTASEELNRLLTLESRPVGRVLSREGKHPRDLVSALELALLTAPRGARSELYWQLALARWVAGDVNGARREARKHVRTRPPSEQQRGLDSADQRFRRRARKLSRE